MSVEHIGLPTKCSMVVERHDMDGGSESVAQGRSAQSAKAMPCMSLRVESTNRCNNLHVELKLYRSLFAPHNREHAYGPRNIGRYFRSEQ